MNETVYRVGCAFACILALAACGGDRPQSAGTNAITVGENFAYRPTGDSNIRVSVDRVAMKGDKEFLPKDPNCRTCGTNNSRSP